MPIVKFFKCFLLYLLIRPLINVVFLLSYCISCTTISCNVRNSPMLKGLENIEEEISEVCLKSPKREDVENKRKNKKP